MKTIYQIGLMLVIFGLVDIIGAEEFLRSLLTVGALIAPFILIRFIWTYGKTDEQIEIEEHRPL